MAIVFDGRTAAQTKLQTIGERVAKLDHTPRLGILYPKENTSQETFSRVKQKAGEKIGIRTDLIEVGSHLDTEGICDLIGTVTDSYDGILVQLPLHDGVDRYTVLNSIPYEKDVEGLSAARQGALFQEKTDLYSPVAMACIHALTDGATALKKEMEELSVALIGNSYLIGRPLSLILSRRCREVSICNHRTQNLFEFTEKADVVISGIGKPHTITPEMVSDGAIVIDAGYERSDGSVTGDVHPDTFSRVGFFTPVPGGIGPLTVAYIFENLITLAEKASSRENR